jgi:hypothetical protein
MPLISLLSSPVTLQTVEPLARPPKAPHETFACANVASAATR